MVRRRLYSITDVASVAEPLVHSFFTPVSLLSLFPASLLQLPHLINFQKLDLKFNAKFDLQKHGYELQRLDLVTTTEAKEEAYATMIMGYQKDLEERGEKQV